MLKPLLYSACLFSALGLSALPSHGSSIVPINLNSSSHTNWIKLQETGNKSDRQIIFAQMEQVRPIFPRALLDPPIRTLPPNKPQPIKPNMWLVRLITVNESIHQPGYLDSQAEVDCQQPKMRVVQKVAVPYSAIQSPEIEMMEAYKKKLRTIQPDSPGYPTFTLQAPKGEPWQPIATSSPVFKFVCNQPSWFNAISRQNGPASLPIAINTAMLAREGFTFVGGLSVAPQDLFAYAWNQVWTDGERPAQWSQTPSVTTKPILKPPLPTYIVELGQAGVMTDRAIGAAAAKPSLYSAFEEALKAGSELRPEIDWLLNEGTPAGRIYGAVLLLHIDAKAGRQALEQMQSDQTLIGSNNPLFFGQMTPVSTIVKEILNGSSTLPLPQKKP